MELVDSHAHLQDRAFAKDIQQVIDRFRESGVKQVVCVSYDIQSIQYVVKLAEKYDFIFASAGVHPHDAKNVPENYIEELSRWGNHPRVVAMGEMGLDFYRDLSPREVQKKVFTEQLRLAKRLNKPVIIHDRDAHEAVLNILRREGLGAAGGVMHCFSGSKEMARECVELGLYISLAGPVTYKNARKLKEVAESVPISRLLLETDCPYLTPEPLRGKRNEPANVKYIAEQVAKIRGISTGELASATSANARQLFNLQ